MGFAWFLKEKCTFNNCLRWRILCYGSRTTKPSDSTEEISRNSLLESQMDLICLARERSDFSIKSIDCVTVTHKIDVALQPQKD